MIIIVIARSSVCKPQFFPKLPKNSPRRLPKLFQGAFISPCISNSTTRGHSLTANLFNYIERELFKIMFESLCRQESSTKVKVDYPSC